MLVTDGGDHFDVTNITVEGLYFIIVQRLIMITRTVSSYFALTLSTAFPGHFIWRSSKITWLESLPNIKKSLDTNGLDVVFLVAIMKLLFKCSLFSLSSLY